MQITGQTDHDFHDIVVLDEFEDAVDVAFVAVLEPRLARHGLHGRGELRVTVGHGDTNAHRAHVERKAAAQARVVDAGLIGFDFRHWLRATRRSS